VKSRQRQRPEPNTSSDDPSNAWTTNEIKDLLRAVLSLETLDEAEHFFRDLCTLSELEAMAHRWQVAKLVDRGLPYQEIAREAHASTTTVTRVAHWLRHGEGGYRLAIDRTQKSTRRRG
jgi:TrpR-related protein YerC/YecD